MRKFLAALLAALVALSGLALAEDLEPGDVATDDLTYSLAVSSIERAPAGLEVALTLQNLDIAPMALDGLGLRLAYGETEFVPDAPLEGRLLPLEETTLSMLYAVPEAAFSGDFGMFLLTLTPPGGGEFTLDVLAALGLAVEGAPAAALAGEYVPLAENSLQAKLGDIAVEPVEGRDTIKRVVVALKLRNGGDEALDIAGDLSAQLQFRGRYAFEPVEPPAEIAVAAGEEVEIRYSFEVANAVVDSGEEVQLLLTMALETAALPFVPAQSAADAQSESAQPAPAAMAVEAGYRHSFAIGEDGTLWAWGSGEYGRLGTGDASMAYMPRAVELENVVAASAGYYHSLFLTADGGVWAAGCNYDYGQVGDGTAANRMTPVRVLDGGKQVLAGRDYSAVVKEDGTLWVWGRNDEGQLGLGDTQMRATPVQAALEGVLQIAGGEKFLLALLEDGSVRGWGANPYGQLREGESSLVPVDMGPTGVRAIAAGNNHAIALLGDDEIYLWGDNAYGQLGINGEIGGDMDFLAVEAGGDMSAVQTEDGSWWVWGDLFGAEPKQLDKPAAASLSLGFWHALALEGNGSMWGTGSNDYWQIGDTYEDTYKSWIELDLNLREVLRPADAPKERDKAAVSEPFAAAPAAIAAGYYTSFALDAEGRVWTWGRSDYGQLGAGEAEKLEEPTQIEGISPVVQMAAGDYHTLFVTESGDLYGAGCSYDHNQLGNGTYEDAREPVYIMSGVVRAWAGRDTSAALRDDGTLWTWGANGEGELGLGHALEVDAPAQVALEGVVDLAVGKRFMAALLEDGTVWTWGSNEYGQLGRVDTGEAGAPAPLALEGVVSIAAGSAHALALDADGAVWAWGAGAYGQIGTGDESNQPTPVKVGGAEGAVAVLAGGDTSAARLPGGKVLAWGGYFYARPSEEDIGYFDSAKSISVYVDIADIAMGSFHILATDAEGNVYSIGDNSYGQLGIGGGFPAPSYYYYLWNRVGLDLKNASYTQPQATPKPKDGSQALSAA